MQAQGVGGKPLKYLDMTDVIQKTVTNEGFFGLYKVRIVAVHATCQQPWATLSQQDPNQILNRF